MKINRNLQCRVVYFLDQLQDNPQVCVCHPQSLGFLTGLVHICYYSAVLSFFFSFIVNWFCQGNATAENGLRRPNGLSLPVLNRLCHMYEVPTVNTWVRVQDTSLTVLGGHSPMKMFTIIVTTKLCIQLFYQA